MNIKDLEIGKSAKITKVGGEGALRQHFLDMGSYSRCSNHNDKICTYG